MADKPRIRRSLTDIQADYDSGDTAELEKLMRAWKGIKERPATDVQSFFVLGGYHGEPFRGPGATTATWWGGYCQHGTVLFPTWHRAYLVAVEKALQSVPGCEDVTLPFWDECSEESRKSGIPRALTDETFVLDGQEIPNPLRSYRFPTDIVDGVDPNTYSKAAGYETVRYPLSGLVGTPEQIAETKQHNAKFPDPETNVRILNHNVTQWLNNTVKLDPSQPPVRPQGHVFDKFVAALDAPTYTLFSNTTSAGSWNKANPARTVTPLESPHNSVHLAVGGFDLQGTDLSTIRGANGDMGENDTAGLDPIFFFHHCFIDYVFWTWQRRHLATTALTIDAKDPGAVYVVAQDAPNQPPADADASAPITTSTPLDPFEKAPGEPVTTDDVVDIEGQLGYTYGPGSLDHLAEAQDAADLAQAEAGAGEEGRRTLRVAGLSRGEIAGSFLITVHADVGAEAPVLVGHEAVLSRWGIEGCANCQQHLRVAAHFGIPPEHADTDNLIVTVQTHAGPLAGGPATVAALLAVSAESEQVAEEADRPAAESPRFTVELV